MKPKRIGIDARLYFQTGVGTYLRNLLHFLPVTAPKNVEFYIYVLPEDRKKILFKDNRFILREVEARWHSLSEQTTLYRVLMQDELDLMHFTYFSFPIFYKKPFIATIHDLTPLLFKTGRASTLNPYWYELKFQIFKKVLSSQIQNAKMIITPSETVKKQIEDVYGKEYTMKILPIHEGVNFELVEAKEDTRLKEIVGRDFFLYVGNFYPHKNVDRLIEAYTMADTKTPLVLTGPDNGFAQKLKKSIPQENKQNIHFVHETSNDDLIYLYKHAKALVNPSLSEGFGLPLVEAAYFGCPVIASDIPVFKELLGDQYSSFDPQDEKDITQKLRSMSSQLQNRNELLQSEAKTLVKKRFSFETMAKETYEIYEQCA